MVKMHVLLLPTSIVCDLFQARQSPTVALSLSSGSYIFFFPSVSTFISEYAPSVFRIVPLNLESNLT